MVSSGHETAPVQPTPGFEAMRRNQQAETTGLMLSCDMNVTKCHRRHVTDKNVTDAMKGRPGQSPLFRISQGTGRVPGTRQMLQDSVQAALEEVAGSEALLGPLSPPGKSRDSNASAGEGCQVFRSPPSEAPSPPGQNTPTSTFLKRRCDSQVTPLPSKKCKSHQLRESVSQFPPSPGRRREGPCSSLGAGGLSSHISAKYFPLPVQPACP